MPVFLETPVLTVDANVIHKIDTGNPQNLFSMWTVFSKCVHSVEQGRRLENLSWRLWTRETFCVEEEKAAFAPSQPQEILPTSRISDCPQLSGSVDSIVEEEEAVELSNEADPVEIRPSIIRQDSCASSRSRGRERHITSGDLEKMVVGIIEQKEPLTAPLPSIPSPTPVVEEETMPVLERTGSTTTVATDQTSDGHSEDSRPGSSPESLPSMKTTNVVRGFSPSVAPLHRTVASVATQKPQKIPAPTSAPAAKPVQAKKGGRFDIGPSSSPDSYSDAANSPQLAKTILPQKKSTFMIGAASSDESSGNNSVRPSMLAPQKKHAAFSNKVSSQSIQESSAVAEDSETDGDDVDESAIDDDDDSSEWEDSIEDSGKSSFDDKNMFQRVDSKANLTSRRSLITFMIEQNEQRTRRLGNTASQSTSALNRNRTSHSAAPAMVSSPNDSDDAPLTMKRAMRGTPLKPINEVSRTVAQPILSNNHAHHQQAALSPRTTRRNMLATELTESLRRHLLWERQQKSSTANAVLKRRHTSHDVANLKQYPERPYFNKAEDANASSWNEYWTKEAFTGYHTQGW